MDQVIGEPTMLYREDWHVGQRFVSARYHMDEKGIQAFATEFDPQPFQLDEGVAQTSIFRGLSASGWHTAAVTMHLLVTGGLPLANHRIRRRVRMDKAHATRRYAASGKRGP